MKGEGNQQDYGMRIYDPRVGRFLSVDPLTKDYPELTPYQFASNRPIDGVDLDGQEYLKTIPKFEYSGNNTFIDYVSAIDNGVINIVNLVPTTWNSIVATTQSLKRGTYVKDLTGEAKQAGAALKQTANNFVKAPFKTLSSPESVEFFTEAFIGAKIFTPGAKTGNLLNPAKSSPSIALGLDEPVAAGPPRSLPRFADQNLALYHKQWQSAFGSIASGKSFGEIFTKVMDHVVSNKGTVKFDLTNLDLKRVARDRGLTAEASSSYTNWEFNQVMGNEKYLKSTIFYENGAVKATKDVIRDYQNAIKASTEQ